MASKFSRFESRYQTLSETLQLLDSELLALRGCVLSLGTKFEDAHTRSELKRLRGVISMRLAGAHKEVMSGRGKESLEGQAQQLESHMTMFRELLLELKKGSRASERGFPELQDIERNLASLKGLSTTSKENDQRFQTAELADLEKEVVDLKAGMREAIDVVVARGERLEDLSEYTNTRADHFSSREPTGSSIPSGRELSKNVKSLDERLKAVYDVVVEREARLREGVNVGGVESEDTLSLEKYQQLLIDLEDLQPILKDIQTMVGDSEDEIDRIERSVEVIPARVETGTYQLKTTQKTTCVVS